MSKTTIHLESELWARVKQHSETAGYSSPNEFVEHALQKAMESTAVPESEEKTARSLRGIGYLDAGLDI